LPSGAFDPAGLRPQSNTSAAADRDRSCKAALGTVAAWAIFEKVAPELFGVLTWAGAKGPGVGGGKKKDIYKVVPLGESKAGPGATKVLMNQDQVATSDAAETPSAVKKSAETQMQRKEFGWKKIYHALLGPTGPSPEGGFVTEIAFTPTPMRMYTDHRVMGRVVLPGVSHVSLMAATGLVAFAQRDGSYGNDEQAVIKDVLFERPYVVGDGTEVFAPDRHVPDPSGMGALMPGEIPGGIITYCRATHVSRERGNQGRR